jgi:hypothetical protein
MSWPGAVLYKSSDGSTYDPAATLPTAAIIGAAMTALGDCLRWPTWDDVNTVTIKTRNSQILTSAASDLEVLNGANLAYLQGEVLQFVTATDLGNSEYQLSRLLRGRFGTEAKVSTHVVGDQFVLLTRASVIRLPINTVEINAERYYRGVTRGLSLSMAPTQPVTCTGASLTPYAVCSIAGTRDGSNNLTLTWLRRTRIGGAWLDYVDVPLSENTEAYEIDVMDGADVVRTLTATAETVGYTAAEQTTDFGSPQASLTVKLYQLSGVVGRGYAATATV